MNPISKIYFGLEDRYYGFCDWLEKTGIKIYEWFVNPIEDRGVPSFPFFIILLAIIIGGAAFFALNFKSPFADTVSMDIAVLSDGQPVDGAQVIITLEDGKEFTALSKNGIAHFDGLPKDAQASIKVQHPSGKFEKNIVLTGDKLVALLEPLRKSFRVIVANDNGDPVAGAQITFSDPDTGSLQQYSTDATGTAEIIFTNDNALFRLRVTADGFKSEYKSCSPTQQSCQILLSSTSTGSQIETKGSVVVNVKDEQGNPVKGATVSLYNANGYSQIITSAITDEEGSVFLREAIAVGTQVYVGVEASGFVSYHGIENNDVQAVGADKNTEFIVTLAKKSGDGGLPTDFTKVSITVVDEKDQPISGADVKLFLYTRPLSVLGEQQADDSGTASFEVSKDGVFYATAVADGFLPKTTRQLKGGEATKIGLVSAAAGNNGELEVTVRDADGNYIANANVELVSDDGFNLGYVPQESGSDGIASFAQVETAKPMRALAVFGSQSGESDVFQVSSGETTKVEVTLERNTAKMLVRAKDYSQSQDAFLNATITAFYKGSAIGSCQNSDDGSYCNITVYANVPITLQANASGFADYSSEQITLSSGQELQKTIAMLPSDLAKDVVIMNFTAFQMDSLGNTIIDAEHPATSFERGGWYKVLLVVNLPQSQKSGFYLRAGDKTTIAEEKAFIAEFDAPSSDEHATVDFGTTYNQDATCAQQSQQQSGNEIKWVNIQYPSGSVGVKTLAVKVRVRPTATTTNRIDLHYRAYAVKNGLWARVPADADLGSKENVAGKQSCFADTIKADYAVTQGFQKCTDKGCITLTLSGDGRSASRFLSVPYGTQVELNADVKSFAPDMITNPTVKFSTTSNKLDIDRNVNNVELVDGEASASTFANAHAPGNYMPVTAEFYSDEGTIASSNGVLEFTGTGQLVLTVEPLVMQANVPPGNEEFKPIKATLTTGNGRPVENAIITIEETGDTHPFLGFPNGGDSIIGNGQQGMGKDGVYIFRSVYPKTIGTFQLKADAGSDFEKPLSAEVQVVAGNFLSIDPQDYAFITQQACENGLQLSLTKNIPVELKKIYYQVSGGSNESQCVEVIQPPTSPFSMRKNQGQTDVIVKPIQDGACALTFSSTLEGSGSAAETQANFNVRCNLNPSPSPSPTGTPLPTTSACSPSNCAACNEQQCLNLQGGGFCKAAYSDGSFQGQVSIEDINSMQFNPSTIVVKPNTQITWKNNGILNHTVAFDASNQTSAVIEPGETFTLNGFAQTGTYTYHCSIHPQMTGKIIVSNNPSNFLSCQQGNQSNGGNGGTNHTPDACMMYKFDFGQILAGRIGYLAGQRIFNPDRNQMIVASSASNIIIHEPSGPGFRTVQMGDGCQPDGINKLTCVKKVSPLVPSNGIAVSVKNALGFDTNIQIQKNAGESCFEFKQIKPQGLAQIGDLLQDVVTGAFGLPGSRYATFTVLFDASKQGCADYTFNTETGALGIKPADGKSVFEVILSDSRIPGSAYTVRLEIQGIESSFAIASAPRLQKDVYSNFPTREDKPLEPFLITNNLAFDEVAFGSSVIAPRTAAGLALSLDTPNAYPLLVRRGSAPIATIQPTKQVVETNRKYDVNGMPLKSNAYLDCSKQGFCFVEDDKVLREDIKRQVSQDLMNVITNMDVISYTAAYDYDRVLLERAVNDALQEYIANLISYQVCKAAGPDPLQSLVNKCNSIRQNPLGAQNLGESFGTGFTAAACDSEIINIAYSASRGVTSYQPGYLQQLSRRLVSQYFVPETSNVPFSQRIFRGLNATISVPVRIAGENGGFVIYTFKPDANAIMLAPGMGVPDQAFAQGFGGTPCINGVCQNGGYCMPNSNTCMPQGVYNNYQGMQNYNYNGVQGSFLQYHNPAPTDLENIITLKGTYGYKPNFKKPSTDDKSQSSQTSYSDGIPYLGPDGLRTDANTPNLFTMNKYGFDSQVDSSFGVQLQPPDQSIPPCTEFQTCRAGGDNPDRKPVFDAGTDASTKMVADAIAQLKQDSYQEDTIKVVIVPGSDNRITISEIGSQGSQNSGSSSPTPSPSASPSASPSVSPSPSPNGFTDTGTGVPSDWASKSVGSAKTTTPIYQVTLQFSYSDMSCTDESTCYKQNCANEPSLCMLDLIENTKANSQKMQDEVKGLTEMLKYLLDENLKITCDYTVQDENTIIIPDAKSCSTTEIPPKAKAGGVKADGDFIKNIQKWIDDIMGAVVPGFPYSGTDQTTQAPSWHADPFPPASLKVTNNQGLHLVNQPTFANASSPSTQVNFRLTSNFKNPGSDVASEFLWRFVFGVYDENKHKDCAYDQIGDFVLQPPKILRYTSSPSGISTVVNAIENDDPVHKITSDKVWVVKAYYTGKTQPTQRYECYKMYWG